MGGQDKQYHNIWACPKCGRSFQRIDQSHSCKTYLLDQHFSGKEKLLVLFNKLCEAINSNVGPFTLDSIKCCIHLVHQTTFAAVKVMKAKLRIDFRLDYEFSHERISKSVQMSKYRFLYYTDIEKEEEIDAEVLQLLKVAYLKGENADILQIGENSLNLKKPCLSSSAHPK